MLLLPKRGFPSRGARSSARPRVVAPSSAATARGSTVPFIPGVRGIAFNMALSKWFGPRIFWAYVAQLGWHLAFQPK
jgi:hypothetical protein